MKEEEPCVDVCLDISIILPVALRHPALFPPLKKYDEDTLADEKPSFAPNGRMLLYATEQQGKEALMMTTVDGKVKARLTGSDGDIRQPQWGPSVR